jgi:hypothetical protein
MVAQISITLQPDSSAGKDVILDSYAPTTNYAAFPEFNAAAWTYQGDPIVQRGLIDFDLSALPQKAKINSAFLTLYFNPTSSNNVGHSQLSGSNASVLQRVTDIWNEFSVNWDNQPRTTTQNEIILPADTHFRQNYTVDVTALLQDMVDDTAGSFGFMLKLQSEIYYRILIFASSDHPDTTLHPKLVINYSNPASVEPISKSNMGIVAYPNPATQTVTIKINNTANEPAVFSLEDATGRVVMQKSIVLQNGTTDYAFHMGEICEAGMYYISVATNSQTFTSKIMIKPEAN